MAKITQTNTMNAGDWFVLWQSNQGDWRGISGSDVLAYIQANTAASLKEPNTQYSAPVDGGTILVDDNNEDTHLIITPAIGLALLTITLPALANLRDKQVFICNTTQAVAGLTIGGNGATVAAGAPTALLINEYFTLKYDATLNTWYRIG